MPLKSVKAGYSKSCSMNKLPGHLKILKSKAVVKSILKMYGKPTLSESYKVHHADNT